MAYKRCPGCGGQVLVSVAVCGACGFRFPSEQALPVQAEVAQRLCPACGTATRVDAFACHRCGHYFRTRYMAVVDAAPGSAGQYQTSGARPDEATLPWQPTTSRPASVNVAADAPSENGKSDYGAVVAMWLLTAGAWAAFALFGVFTGLAIDAAAVFIAISLVISRSPADRANGWVKLGLEIIGFLVGLILGASGHRYY